MKVRVIYLLAGIAFSMLACKSTSTQIDVLQPAEIFIPEHIETIVTIDRSKPASGFLSFLEGALSGEQIGQDREGRRRALEGLAEALTRTPRFAVRHSGYEKTGSNARLRLIEPMNWYEIKALCDEFDADAVLAIEMYDSDVIVSMEEKERKNKDKEGNETIEKYFDADMDLSIQMGWRLYDPKSSQIIDEFTTRDDDSGSAQGESDEQARERLPDTYRMARDISFHAGRLYGERIAPTWISVSRSFYSTVKGPDQSEMERATRMAETRDWKGAAKIWNQLVSRATDQETRGKAAFNMAVANECLGKLEIAKDWAQRAYVNFGNKKARGYLNTIERRIYEQQLVAEQMGIKGN